MYLKIKVYSQNKVALDEMKKLTDITWPAIANRIKEILNEPSSQNKVRVIEAAVLFEADWKDFDQVYN